MNLLKKIFGWNNIESSHRLMLVIVLTLGLLNFFWGEKVTAGGGFGWDGVYYAEMVRHLDTMVSNGELGSYYMQRILPAACVRGVLLLTGMPINDDNIINGFEIYNLLILVLICFSWKRISEKLSLSISGRWIGFSGIFINFECSKQSFFYPVLTDVTALLAGTLLLLFYLEKKPVLIFIVSVVGAFCWPVVSTSGALLIFFLKTVLPDNSIRPPPLRLKIQSIDKISAAKNLFICILVFCVIGYIALVLYTPTSEQVCGIYNLKLSKFSENMPISFFDKIQRSINGADPCLLEKILIQAEKLLTAIPSILILFVALLALIGSTSFFKYLISSLREIPLLLFILAVLVMLIPALLIKHFANPVVANPSSLLVLIRLTLFPQEGKFFLPFVSLAVFWGPVVLLIIIYWQEFCIQTRKLGPGVVAVIALALILGMVGEPRFLTIGWPFLVLGLVLTLEDIRFKPEFKPVFIILTIIFAQFWMILNYEPWMPPDGEGLQDFPKQLYFMHYGLWMSWITYLVQLAILVLSALVLRKTFFKNFTKHVCIKEYI